MSTSLFLLGAGGVESSTKFSKKGGGLTRSQFLGGLSREDEGGVVVQFLHKNKLKSEIFNKKKKFINKNVFLCQFKLRI